MVEKKYKPKKSHPWRNKHFGKGTKHKPTKIKKDPVKVNKLALASEVKENPLNVINS